MEEAFCLSRHSSRIIVLPLLQSFDFTLAESPSTHKAGNQLDLIFTRNCALPNITNDLLDPNQSGFRAGHSTETALLAVTEALHGAKSQSLSSALLLLDLSATFDTVDHRILLSSLIEMGISGSALTWFESYLADRSYQVAWRGSLSSPHTLSTGVPQGSVLGPVLFSLYTKSLGSVISAHGFSYHCYADDTQLFLSFSPSDTQVPARISACLADISAWMSAHRCNPGQPAVLLEPNCSDHSDLPFLPPQHPEDPTVPHPRGHSTPGPGPGDLTSGLLQFLAAPSSHSN
ncbi:hypothetical protein AAFF_G00151830 [Aldrovandia affinis]|uniref:Reverse transcriptase domain-containing protein n=1 Tax=Aldrovandia affinis TaxID=143900 RepID=A0AAD7RP77_9TELE|nr:hypothetical protein AAFF_G00151830 [Aldrovandia affinis]